MLSPAAMYYCDHNSTAPLLPNVQSAMEPFWSRDFGNPSALQTAFGRQAAAAVEIAREEVAKLVGAKPAEVIFVSGGTESCYAALMGAALALDCPTNFSILTSAVEHAAVRETLSLLTQVPFNAVIRQLAVNRTGEIAEFSRQKVDLCSVMLANNETGVVSPLAEIIKKIQANFFHSDVTQAVGRVPVNFSTLNLDAISFSAHKIGGPKGIGALVLRESAKWRAPMLGGGQENHRRGGTEAVPLIVGFGEAAKTARLLSSGARDTFETIVGAGCSEIEIVGKNVSRLPNTSSIVCRGISAFEAVKRLEERGVIVSAGAACQTRTFEPSRVLKTMGFSDVEALGALRISFGGDQTTVDAKQIAEIFVSVIKELQQLTGTELKARLANG